MNGLEMWFPEEAEKPPAFFGLDRTPFPPRPFKPDPWHYRLRYWFATRILRLPVE